MLLQNVIKILEITADDFSTITRHKILDVAAPEFYTLIEELLSKFLTQRTNARI